MCIAVLESARPARPDRVRQYAVDLGQPARRLPTSLYLRPRLGLDPAGIDGSAAPSPGGGDRERQIQSILSVAAHIGKALTKDEAAVIGETMFGQGRTFRSGLIGDWQNHYDDELKELFKKESGDQLIQFGYEKDFDW